MSALNGTYHETDSVFFDESDMDDHLVRLRAHVHRLNTAFSDYMRKNGEKRKIVSRGSTDGLMAEDELEAAPEDLSDGVPEEGQLLVTAAEMKEWVKEIYIKNRGKELPGNYNHVLLSELFHIQSSRWHEIAENHLETLHEKITAFVIAVLHHIARDEQVLVELLDITGGSLLRSKKAAKDELQKLLEDEKQQPITYNHYYTDNVQHSRQESTRKLLRKAMDETRRYDWNGKLHVSNTSFDAEKLLGLLQKRVVVNMDGQACAEALAGLSAYYKVAMKTFVDNVCRQVVERHLLRTLPDLFCPEIVALFSDEELRRIAAESSDNIEKRQQLRELHKSLGDSLQDLRR
ncbi:hypothetical protein LTR16_000589 [Cryomyces antarcticus]|uniref:GED domain-containing protein n=1 Tax=Cryomyces antarcticus TaxID=329879 RepID=A0ABR0KUL2_9PEZI|nr:hypothetical protein LTR39_001497 [Cryomyces antarcticus]KAK5020751.1 hypothetical protein LTR60_000262 [Cryomyces antarcticus]KAK5131625.1 hypothetical protein LTR16_000589 [Cryomyces antarcticus]